MGRIPDELTLDNRHPTRMPARFMKEARRYFDAALREKALIEAQETQTSDHLGPEGFLFAHAVELCLKALLLKDGLELEDLAKAPFKHSLKNLLNECRQNDSFEKAISTLDIHLIEVMGEARLALVTRYPDEKDRNMSRAGVSLDGMEGTVRSLFKHASWIEDERLLIPEIYVTFETDAGPIPPRPPKRPSAR